MTCFQNVSPVQTVPPRLLVLTDITSIVGGYKEPDDAQSLVRLLSMANEYRIEGLVASSRLGHGQDTRPEFIEAILHAYGKVQPSLARHAAGFPEAAHLLKTIFSGQPKALPDLPVRESVGPDRDTAGSEWIRHRLELDTSEPLAIAVWGGTADLAQALWRMRQEGPRHRLEAALRRGRVFAIGDQDSTGPWIRAEFPELFYLLCRKTFRGWYRWGDRSLATPEWIDRHVRAGHGALGAAYPQYHGGDIFWDTMGPVHGMKEGDTLSFLHFFPNGLNCPDRPDWDGWAGRYKGGGDCWEDLDGSCEELAPLAGQWRADAQAELAMRMDWCVEDYDTCAHPPVVRVHAPVTMEVEGGSILTIEARESTSPDGTPLDFEWLWKKQDCVAPFQLLATGPELAWRTPFEPGVYALILRLRNTRPPHPVRYWRGSVLVGTK